MERQDTGLLLIPKDIKLHRNWFKEMTRLIGIQVLYREPKANKHYNGYGELDSFYEKPICVGCIFEERPTQSTTRKLGWNAELMESSSIIHVPYDLQGLQIGSIFVVPSGVDNSIGRLFRVIKMSTISVYPASISCEIAPIWENTFDKEELDYRERNLNLLSTENDMEDV